MKIFGGKYPKENRKDKLINYIQQFSYYGLFIMVAILLVSILFVGEVDIHKGNHLFGIGAKKQIFTYLKSVQNIEEDFYKILQQNNSFLQEDRQKQKAGINILTEHIKATDELLLQLVEMTTNPYIIENHNLFLEEILSLRDTMVEQKIQIENEEIKNDDRINFSFEKYKLLAQARRVALKKLFEQQNITYVDLGDRIKYKVK